MEEFPKDGTKKSGHHPWCKVCKNKNTRRGREKLSNTARYNKIKESLLKKYGVDNPSKIDSAKKKREKTFIQRYGETTPLKNKEVRDKGKKTLQKTLGVDNPLKATSVKEKVKQTNLRKYGTTNPLNNNEEVKEKSRRTIKKKFGVDNVSQSDRVKEQKKSTSFANYGVDHPLKSEEIKRKVILTKYNKGEVALISWEGKDVTIPELAERYGRSSTQALRIYRTYGFEVLENWLQNKPEFLQSSSGEQALLEFIKSNYTGEVISRYKLHNNELDIFLPELNLAFEFNGSYWHSFPIVSKDFHKNKTHLCQENGIQLIHIYEIDWLINQSILKNLILSKLGKTQKIFARDCEVRKITDSEYKSLVSVTHLQGYVPAKYRYGLFYKEELVGCMSFGSRKFNKEKQSGNFELLRFCTKGSIQVVGGASKLLSNFIKEVKPYKITSYANRDISNGNLYVALGFEFGGCTSPGLFYVKNSQKFSRQSLQKYKLKNILPNFDTSKTELVQLLESRYLPIFTSGNLRYELYPSGK